MKWFEVRFRTFQRWGPTRHLYLCITFLNPTGHYAGHVKLQPLNVTQFINIQKLWKEHDIYAGYIKAHYNCVQGFLLILQPDAVFRFEQRFSTLWDSRTTYKFYLWDHHLKLKLKIVAIGLFGCLYPYKIEKIAFARRPPGRWPQTTGGPRTMRWEPLD